MKFRTSDGLSSVDRTPSGDIAYIHGHQLLGALVNGNFHYFISDGLSTIREVVDESGSMVATFEGDEFGQVIAQSGPAELLEHTYTGALGVRNDGAVLGLHYAQQPYYDPALGKWISADPIGFEGGLNLTGYVGQNPINNADPEGLVGPGILAPWIVETFQVIAASQGARTTCIWAGRRAFQGSLLDFAPAWLAPSALGSGAAGLGLYFGSNAGRSVNSPTGPLVLMGIPSQRSATGQCPMILREALNQGSRIKEQMTSLALPDGPIVNFSLDTGNHAHSLPPPYRRQGKIPHVNIELQGPGGRQILNQHILLDNNNKPTAILDKHMRRMTP